MRIIIAVVLVYLALGVRDHHHKDHKDVQNKEKHHEKESKDVKNKEKHHSKDKNVKPTPLDGLHPITIQEEVPFALFDDTRATDRTIGQHAEKIASQAEEYDHQMGDFDDNDETDKVLKTLQLQEAEDPQPEEVNEEQFLKSKNKKGKKGKAGKKDKADKKDKVVEDYFDDDQDEHDDSNDGDTQWIIVTSFTESEHNSGKVWVTDRYHGGEAFQLVSGLHQPLATCFDNNHDFLYVCDSGWSNQGSIYQYKIDYDDDDKFELKQKEYYEIYTGKSPVSCSVDEYGNLYFATIEDKIFISSYFDVWSGFKNMHTMLYDSKTERISGIMGLVVRNSEELWYVNSKDTINSGALNLAEADSTLPNSGRIQIAAKANEPLLAVTSSDDYVFFTSYNQVFKYDWETDELLLKSIGFEHASGISYGDEYLFVADHGTGEIFKIDEEGGEDHMHSWIQIEGAYGVYAVNAAYLMMAVVLFALI